MTLQRILEEHSQSMWRDVKGIIYNYCHVWCGPSVRNPMHQPAYIMYLVRWDPKLCFCVSQFCIPLNTHLFHTSTSGFQICQSMNSTKQMVDWRRVSGGSQYAPDFRVVTDIESHQKYQKDAKRWISKMVKFWNFQQVSDFLLGNFFWAWKYLIIVGDVGGTRPLCVLVERGLFRAHFVD